MGSAGKTRKVDALDGLRAIAVLLVVLYHAMPQVVPGGFLGVDVFFVLSGYLITGVLVRDIRETGHVRMGRFWVRRIRRLLPALVTMLALVSAAVLVLPGDVRVSLGRQLLGAITYSSNWLSIAAGDDYFDRSNPSIFAHLWSLAIEEQYYIVWPLLVALMLVVLKWRRHRAAAVALSLAAASALLMAVLFAAGADTTRLYYGTDTHTFGLFLGAALAFVAPVDRELIVRAGSAKAANVAGLASIGLVIVLAFTIHDQGATAYQGGMFAASLAISLVIVIVTGRRSVVARVLAVPLLVWLGRRSYGLYLWHWPVIVIAATLVAPSWRSPLVQTITVFGVVGVSVCIAAASYRWIERPIMRDGLRSSWRALSVARSERGSAPSRVRLGSAKQRAIVAVGAASVLLSVLSVVSAPAHSSLESDLIQQQQILSDAPDDAGSESTGGGSTPAPSVGSTAGPSLPSESGSASATPQVSEPLTGSQILAIGDSVMLASAKALKTTYPGIRIDAKVSRQASEVFSALAVQNADNPNRRVFIIGTGTNGPVKASDLASAIDALGPEAKVVLVNVYADRPWAGDSNDAIATVASSRANVEVADWLSQARNNPDDLYGDGIHPRPQGAPLYVNAVTTALKQLGLS